MRDLITIGILLILIGFALTFIGALQQTKESDGKTKVAVGGFIGPIPFGFGNDKQFMYVIIVLSLFFFLLWFFLRKSIT